MAVPGKMILRHMPERSAGAFSVLVPEGWQMVGGIVRSNLMVNPPRHPLRVPRGPALRRPAEGSPSF